MFFVYFVDFVVDELNLVNFGYDFCFDFGGGFGDVL